MRNPVGPLSLNDAGRFYQSAWPTGGGRGQETLVKLSFLCVRFLALSFYSESRLPEDFNTPSGQMWTDVDVRISFNQGMQMPFLPTLVEFLCAALVDRCTVSPLCCSFNVLF